MSIAVTIESKRVVGDRRRHAGTLNLGNPYAAGGIAYTASNFGLDKVEQLWVEHVGFLGTASVANMRFAVIERTTNKAGLIWLLEEDQTSGVKAEETAIDVSGCTFRWEAVGQI